MNGARNLARRHVRAAFRLERADVAVVLSGEVEKRAALGQAVARLGEVPVVFLQLFAAGADIDVGFGVVDEVAAGKGSVDTLGFVHQFHVRLDPALVHQPPDHVGRAVTRVGDQARRREIKSLSRAIEHRLGRAGFGLAFFESTR
jgi:hypothetical protein